MTATLRFSRQARVDLVDIWRGIARHNDVAADRIVDRIEGACRRLHSLILAALGPISIRTDAFSSSNGSSCSLEADQAWTS